MSKQSELILIVKRWRTMLEYAIEYHEGYMKTLKQKNIYMEDVEEEVFNEINDIITFQKVIYLEKYQLIFILMLLDYTNKVLLKTVEPSYSEDHMTYFADSQKFMEKYNTYDDISEAWERVKAILKKP